MFDNGYKTLALMISGVSGIFQRELSQYFQQYAKKKGYNLAVFSSFIGYETNREYVKGESNIVNLPPYERFDGLVVVPDTFRDKALRDSVLKNISERCTCPVVSIRSDIENFYSVNTDNALAMEEMIKHFIEDHHMKKIAFLSGTKGHPDAVVRLECYKRVMKEYNLPVEESMIYHGNFWDDLGKEYFDYFLLRDKKDRPEVIVCANDYMAIALCRECLKRGVSVPEDVAISGFDNIYMSETCYPPLTTVGVSTKKMVEMAVSIIEDVTAGKNVPKKSFAPTEVIRRNSCGCKTLTVKNLIDSVSTVRNEYDDVYSGLYRNTYTSVDLERMSDYEDMRSHMDVLYSGNSKIKDLYICTCEKENNGGKCITPVKEGYTDTMRSIYSIRNREYVDNVSFDTKNLVPKDAVESGEPVQFTFSALHYLDATYGYVAHAYIDNVCHSRVFHNWVVMVGNAMESIRVKKELSSSVARLNDLYIKESMTNLYNRRGFEQRSLEIYNRALEEDKEFALIEMDMDNLKKINDTYGHAAGDEAIETIAKVLKSVSGSREICSRVGGDEFWIIAYEYTAGQLEDYIDRFYKGLDAENKTGQRDYDISMSCGSMICKPSDEYTMDKFMSIVDAAMYKNKQEHKARMT